MIKAVLFDMDGVITDTEKYYNRSWTEAMHECGYPEFTNQDALLLRSLNHKDATILLHDMFDADFDTVHEVNVRIVDNIMDTEGVHLKPGINEILTFLKNNNIKSAVATATKYERACVRLEEVGLLDKFDTVISASRVPNGKPYPDVYLYASKEVGELPENCIAVEDSPNGVLSASSAGCKTVMVPDLTQPDEELFTKLYAKADSLTDLIEIIKQENKVS